MTKRELKSAAKQHELAPIHDFAGKLRQPALIGQLRAYVRWQVSRRRRRAPPDKSLEVVLEIPDYAPVSINLDLTTACNYRCHHCVDFEILNTGARYDHQKLKDSLAELAARGLRSVILIGGGEPALYPGFGEILRYLKALGLHVGVVTNGSQLGKIVGVADCLGEQDWVRLSLDSGSDEIFQAMHKPRKKISLDEICAQVPRLKEITPARVGFSFLIVWNDCRANDFEIPENVHEMASAAVLARRYGFDYISFKPFLTRAQSNHAEVIGLTRHEERRQPIMAEIRRQLDMARELAGDGLRVIESTNLKVLDRGTYRGCPAQPRNCHMQFFRQILSPLGVFSCPVYRNAGHAKIGGKHSYSTPESFRQAQRRTSELIERFNAAEECKHVTCLYHHANWFIEDLIRNPDKLDRLQASPEREDYYL